MKSKKLFTVLLAGALTLGAIPLTPFSASGIKGEDLRPSESYSTPIVAYGDEIYETSELKEKDKEELMKGFQEGYVRVPEDPNKPIKAMSEEEVNELRDPNAGTSHIVDITPYPGNKDGYFGYVSFQAKTGNTSKKVHYTTLKRLKGSTDTNDIIYCLQMNEKNPPDGSKMEQLRKESDELLYYIRLGYPRGDKVGNALVPSEIKSCFYTSGDRKHFYNYYITQAAIWAKIGDTDIHAIKRGTVANGAPKDIISKIDKFYHAAPKYGPEWATPKIWVNKKRVEAKEDAKDTSQLCTPAYELDVPAAGDTKYALKLLEKNVFTDAPTSNGNTRVPPAFTMKFTTPVPRGLRVLVYDKRAKKDRVYHIDNGDQPKLYGQDQYRFIIPKPGKSGEFSYEIEGPCWTWKAYRYKSGGYQQMLKEDVVSFGSNIKTNGQIFWNDEKPPTPTPPPPPPTEEDKYNINAKKVDAETGAALQGAKFELTYPNGHKVNKITGADGVARWINILERDLGNGRFTVTEIEAPPGYTLPTNASQTVTLPPQSGDTVTVTFRDQKKKQDSFELKAIKKDAETRNPLQGAEFTLTKPDGTTVKGTSNTEGVVVFSNLTATGRYVIEETRAPQGYQLATNPRQEVNVTDPKNPPTTTFEFLNQKIKEKLYEITATKVDKADKKPLQGAVFTLTGPENYSERATSGADGVVTFNNLKKGTYTLTEVTPPAGYSLARNPTQQVTVPGDTQALIFENEKIPEKLYEITATKVDKADKKPLQGATFVLTGENDFRKEAVTGEDGTVTFSELHKGTYTLTETVPPAGYSLAQNPTQQVTVPGNTEGLIFENEKIPDKGRVELLKYDSVTNKHLQGVEFELFKKGESEDKSLGKFTTDENGKILVENLDPGNYYFVETKGLDGYIVDKEKLEFTIPGEGGLIQLTKGNKPDNASVEITKTDVSTGEVLAGAHIKIYAEDKTTVIAEGDTDSSGKFAFGPLKPGKYYYQETGAPQGYILDDTLFEFEIKPGGEIVKCTMTNKPEEGKVEITKTDVSTGEVLAGAHIKIYAEDKTTVIAGGVTDENGKFAFGPLKPGKYYYQESGAPAGYVLDDKLYPFEVKPGGDIVKCTMTNKPIKGTLEITKVDISDGKLLPNAHFKIYDENKKEIIKGVTDQNGIARFQLGYGKYYYQEYDAPVGYQLDDTLFPFEIKTDGEIVKCRMTNVPKPVPLLPTTGASVAAGGGLIATIGAVASVIFKRWL